MAAKPPSQITRLPLPSELPPRARVHRFSRTERLAHWLHAAGFLGLLATGLILLLPALAGTVGNRPLIKGLHLGIAIGWVAGWLLLMILADRRVLRRSWRQFQALEREDLRWLRSRAARSAPQPRFNGGQKVHGLAQGVLTVLLVVSGVFLWLGERDHSLRLPGALPLHDAAMVIGGAFVLGHIAIALAPATRASLSGMVDGTVPAPYAARHHASWDPQDEPVEQRPALTSRRLLAATAIAGASLALAVWVL